MKEERKVRKANKIIPFKIENVNFVFTTFTDKSSYFTFVHKVDEDKEIKKDSPLLMQFESKSESECIALRNDFHNLLKSFAFDMKDKKKVENQLVEHARDKLNVENSWFNSQYTYVAPVYKNTYDNKGGRQGNFSEYRLCKQIRPVIVLEILRDAGEIIVDNISPNTSGEDFWSFKIARNPIKQFKTSVKTKQYLFSDPANLYKDTNEFFNDVRQPSKGYGKGAIGIVAFLGDNGLFPEVFGFEKKNARTEYSIEYIMKNIYPKVESQYLADDPNLANKYQALDGVKLMNYPRRPFKNNKNIDIIKNYFTDTRRLSSGLVNILVERGLVYGGGFAYSNFDGKGKLKYYNDQFFFHLTNKNGEYSGSERLWLEEKINYQTGDRIKKLEKKNTHPVKGNGFRLMSNSENPSGTFIGEAVIDVLSAYELFRIAGLDANSFNYISIQGCNNLNNFLAINAGFGFELNEHNRAFGEVFAVKIKETKDKISPAKLENYNNNFKNNDYYFVNSGNEICKDILSKIPLANKVLGKEIYIINKKSRDDFIDYKNYDQDKSIFFDETSFTEFFLANKVSFDYDNDTKRHKIMVISEKEEQIKLNNENKQEIYSTMIQNFKTTNLMFGIDNDVAGLKYRSTINNMGKALGINVYDMYPDVIKGQSESDPKVDVNDVLKRYYLLKDANKEDEALKIVEDYVKKLIPNLSLVKKNKVNNKP